MDREEIKQLANAKCATNTNRLALIFFIYSIISGAISISSSNIEDINGVTLSITSSLNLLLAGPLAYGVINVIKTNYDGICPEVEMLFSGFKYFAKLLILNLLITVYVFLWTLLLIVPGIIKAYSYSMAYYVFFDNPNLSAKECLKRSEEMTKGYKMELFKLQFSYIGWILLSILTLGILMYWVEPKMKTAEYEYYLIVSGKKNKILEKEILDDDQYTINFD